MGGGLRQGLRADRPDAARDLRGRGAGRRAAGARGLGLRLGLGSGLGLGLANPNPDPDPNPDPNPNPNPDPNPNPNQERERLFDLTVHTWRELRQCRTELLQLKVVWDHVVLVEHVRT